MNVAPHLITFKWCLSTTFPDTLVVILPEVGLVILLNVVLILHTVLN